MQWYSRYSSEAVTAAAQKARFSVHPRALPRFLLLEFSFCTRKAFQTQKCFFYRPLHRKNSRKQQETWGLHGNPGKNAVTETEAWTCPPSYTLPDSTKFPSHSMVPRRPAQLWWCGDLKKWSLDQILPWLVYALRTVPTHIQLPVREVFKINKEEKFPG